MEKKLLTEVNQIRKMMGLNLLTEASPWADIISRVAGGVARKDIDLMIGKSLKKILITDIESVLTKATAGQVLKKADLDILKALDSEIKNAGNSLGKTNAKGLVGVFEDAMKAAKAAKDPTKYKLLQSQKDEIANSLKSSTGSLPNPKKEVVKSGKEGLKQVQNIAKEFESTYRKAFKDEGSKTILKNVAQELEGKPMSQVRSMVEQRIKNLDDALSKLPEKQKTDWKSLALKLVGYSEDSLGRMELGKTALGVGARTLLVLSTFDIAKNYVELGKTHPELGGPGKFVGAFAEVLADMGIGAGVGASQSVDKGSQAIKREKDIDTGVVNTGGTDNKEKEEKKSSEEKRRSSDGEEEKPKKKPRF